MTHIFRPLSFFLDRTPAKEEQTEQQGERESTLKCEWAADVVRCRSGTLFRYDLPARFTRKPFRDALHASSTFRPSSTFSILAFMEISHSTAVSLGEKHLRHEWNQSEFVLLRNYNEMQLRVCGRCAGERLSCKSCSPVANYANGNQQQKKTGFSSIRLNRKLHLRFHKKAIFRFFFFLPIRAAASVLSKRTNERTQQNDFFLYFYFNQSIEKNILQPNLTRGWLCKKVGMETR